MERLNSPFHSTLGARRGFDRLRASLISLVVNVSPTGNGSKPADGIFYYRTSGK
jgi:hypothetical protein